MIDQVRLVQDEHGGSHYEDISTGETAYRVLGGNYAGLVGNLEKLNRQAARLGVEPVSYRVVGRETVIEKVWDQMQIMSWEVSRTYVYLTVSGGYPHLEGWHFVATIEPTPAGNMLLVHPGERDVPAIYREATNHCDHCQTDRERKQTFVLRHDDGRYAQIGRNCLAKYIGSSISPERLASMAQFERDVRVIGEGGGGALYEVDTLEFLSWVSCLSRNFGFVSAKQAQERWGADPTGRTVWNLLTNSIAMSDWLKEHNPTPEERDARNAQEAREYALGLTGESDFEHNLRVACSLDHITHKQVGTVAYAVEAMRRAREKAAQAAVEAAQPRPVTSHVGTVGKRQTFPDLTIARIMDLPGDWGVRHMVRFLDGAGNTLVWWTSGDISDLEDADDAGSTVTLVATVKAHEEYRGTPQTILTRGKLA